jgi:sensor c-di-GMP phosphodiesterase-like protein
MDEPEKSEGISSPSLPPVVEVRRGSYKSLTLYEVEESELELLAQGSPDSLYLNFAIFLLSVAIALLTSLLTAVLTDRVFTVFVVITCLGFILGTLLLVIWLRKRRSISALVQKIRNRLPERVPTFAADSPDE